MPKNAGAPLKFDRKAKDRFLRLFRENGRVGRSAEGVDVHPTTVIDHRKSDPEFELQYQEALGAYRDELEIEARRRAIEGVQQIKTVGKDGEIYYQQVYSDRLLELMLKAHLPELYRERSTVDLNVTPKPLVVPGMMEPEEWEGTFREIGGNGVPTRRTS